MVHINPLIVRKLASYGRLSMASCLTIMATISSSQSSCQPHHDVNHIIMKSLGLVRDRERLNSQLKRLSGARPCLFFSGKWLFVVAAGGSLFPRVRGSIRESGRQNVHETVARAQFHIKLGKKKLVVSDHFWKMRSTQCVRDSSDTEIEN